MRHRGWSSASAVCAFVVLCAPGPAASQICDPATTAPSCEGNTLSACVNDGSGNGWVQSVDCPALFGALASPLDDHTCGAYGCTGACDDVDVTCVGRAGAACAWQTAGDDPQVFCTPGHGCVLRREAEGFYEVCAPTAACALGQVHAGCAGQLATRCVPSSSGAWALSDAVAVDCGTLGGTCALDDDGAPGCTAPEGGLCDDAPATAGPPLGCHAGLVCTGASATQYGTCTRPVAGPADAGDPPDGASEADSGEGAADPSGSAGGRDAGLADGGAAAAGCSAQHTPRGGAPATAVLALAWLIVILKRR